MSLSTWQDWLAWLGIVIPLATLAWTAVSYTRVEKNKEKENRYNQFFNLMEQIGTANYSLPGKIAAISELKNFPEKKEVIIRFCSKVDFVGSVNDLLYQEVDLTLKHFGHGGRAPSPLGEGGGEGT